VLGVDRDDVWSFFRVPLNIVGGNSQLDGWRLTSVGAVNSADRQTQPPGMSLSTCPKDAHCGRFCLVLVQSLDLDYFHVMRYCITMAVRTYLAQCM
jgi:hypothetical protein